MNEKNIVLNNVEAAKEFVKAASECDFDIDVYFNRIALDAKSLLGILSLDLRSKLLAHRGAGIAGKHIYNFRVFENTQCFFIHK